MNDRARVAIIISISYFCILSTAKPWRVVACCWSPSSLQAWIQGTATIGWLTYLCQRMEGIPYPFRVPFIKPIPSEGLRRVSLLLKENMPLEPMSLAKQSDLTILLFGRVPSRFRCEQYGHIALYSAIFVRFHHLPSHGVFPLTSDKMSSKPYRYSRVESFRFPYFFKE